jgi:hypothetical protein
LVIPDGERCAPNDTYDWFSECFNGVCTLRFGAGCL